MQVDHCRATPQAFNRESMRLSHCHAEEVPARQRFLATKITSINEIADLCEAVAQVNDTRKRAMGRKVITALGGEAKGKTVAILILGLTFKPNTDDMRDAPSLAIVQSLLDAGAHVRALALKRLAATIAGAVMVDLRNVYTPADAEKAEFAYSSIGR